MGTAIKHPVPDRVKSSFVPGTLTLSPDAHMYPYGNSGRQRLRVVFVMLTEGLHS